MQIKDLSKGHCTTLRTDAQIGGAKRALLVSVLGRDVWAYQTAKIQLQNRLLAERRKERGETSS
jgi:hypothetical protein